MVATGSTGVAKSKYDIDTEDTITLTVQWQNFADGSLGTGIYTSSWIAPKSDVHSQQRFFYMGHSGEVNVDQAHRGCTSASLQLVPAIVLPANRCACTDNVAVDGSGFATCNPLFMKYTPTAGKFSGQQGYGYRSFEAFIDTVASINAGETTPDACDEQVCWMTSVQSPVRALLADFLRRSRRGSWPPLARRCRLPRSWRQADSHSTAGTGP